MKIPKVSVIIAGVVLTSFAGVGLKAVSTGLSDGETRTVNIIKDGAVKEMSIVGFLQEYPAAALQAVNPSTVHADLIIGWYDKGYYHGQKMEKALARNLARAKIDGAFELKGKNLR
jgi:hypothetical protein